MRSDVSGTRVAAQRRGTYATRTLSFISGNLPRDRRGRIAQKPGPLSLDEPGSDLDDDTLTPRLGLSAGSTAVGGASGGRELLESLRSPEPVEARQSVGGWGLGAWVEGVSAREKDDDDDDEQTDTELLQVGALVLFLLACSDVRAGAPKNSRLRRNTTGIKESEPRLPRGRRLFSDCEASLCRRLSNTGVL